MRAAALSFVNGVYWLMLALWLGSLVFTGAIAAMLFPMMRDVDLTLPQYAAYGGSHSILLAGRIMAAIFFMQDVVELAAVAILAVILILHFSTFRMPLRRPANVVRVLAAAVLMLLVSYDTFVLAPRMNDNLGAFWRAAQAGEAAEAQRARDAFDADHPSASRLMGFMAFMLVVLVFSSSAALSGGAAPTPASTPAAPRGPQLEEPELLRRMNR
ncbi:MAG: hypothetical protein KJZ69_13110 [Phycisphaerales bacterium]|nr:hypothetical protein [Phycisphaerales bacterium]